MSQPKPLQFLEELQADSPDLAEAINQLATLYQRKLWHQLTVKIDECFSQAEFNRGDIPVRLFNSFIIEFGHKINLLKLAQFAVHSSKFLPSSGKSMEFLQHVIARLEEYKLHRSKEPILFLKTHIAQHKIESAALQEAKLMVEAGKDELATMSDTDPSVSAAVHYVASLYHKVSGNFSEFYRSSLMYLSFVSSESLPSDFKLRLAVDISLAALLGEHIYSFGQLLQHPIIKVCEKLLHGILWQHVTAPAIMLLAHSVCLWQIHLSRCPF